MFYLVVYENDPTPTYTFTRYDSKKEVTEAFNAQAKEFLVELAQNEQVEIRDTLKKQQKCWFWTWERKNYFKIMCVKESTNRTFKFIVEEILELLSDESLNLEKEVDAEE